MSGFGPTKLNGLPYLKRHHCAKVVANVDSHYTIEATDMKITIVGIGLAKNVIQVHGINE